jgi:hypothetical protein
MELTIGTLIKIILGILVFVAVVYGLYISGSYFIDFIKNVVPGDSEIFLSLLK